MQAPNFVLMCYNEQVADVVWNENAQQFYLRRREGVDYPVTLFGCGKMEVPMYEAIEWMSKRCFPKERVDCKELLEMLHLDTYDGWKIVQITHGSMITDQFWLKLAPDEDFYEVTIRGEILKHFEKQK